MRRCWLCRPSPCAAQPWRNESAWLRLARPHRSARPALATSGAGTAARYAGWLSKRISQVRTAATAGAPARARPKMPPTSPKPIKPIFQAGMGTPQNDAPARRQGPGPSEDVLDAEHRAELGATRIRRRAGGRTADRPRQLAAIVE